MTLSEVKHKQLTLMIMTSRSIMAATQMGVNFMYIGDTYRCASQFTNYVHNLICDRIRIKVTKTTKRRSEDMTNFLQVGVISRQSRFCPPQSVLFNGAGFARRRCL